MRAHIGPLLAAGCRVWTHAPPFDHSKLMAVDGDLVLVGSANWDMRSFRLNFEINLEVYHSDDRSRQVSAKITANQTTLLTAADLERRSRAGAAARQRRAPDAAVSVSVPAPRPQERSCCTL